MAEHEDHNLQCELAAVAFEHIANEFSHLATVGLSEYVDLRVRELHGHIGAIIVGAVRRGVIENQSIVDMVNTHLPESAPFDNSLGSLENVYSEYANYHRHMSADYFYQGDLVLFGAVMGKSFGDGTQQSARRDDELLCRMSAHLMRAATLTPGKPIEPSEHTLRAMTQSELAGWLGCGDSTIYKWAGEANVSARSAPGDVYDRQEVVMILRVGSTKQSKAGKKAKKILEGSTPK